jgi:thiamine-monophosphate kinase
VLTGGEDHALAASFPAASALPPGWVEVGQVQEGEGVELVGATIDGSGGFAHFQVSE